MKWESVALPLAVGAIAGASLAQKPPVPASQADLTKLKAGAQVAGPLLFGAAVAVAGIGVLSLSHPKIGAGLVGAGSLLGLMGSMQLPTAPAGSADELKKQVSMGASILGMGLAGLMAWGKPAAQFGSSEVVIGYGGLLAATTLVFMSDVGKLPAQLPPSAA